MESGADMRKYSVHHESYQRTYVKALKRPRPGSDAVLERGAKCRGGKSIHSIKELPILSRSKKCAFCGRRAAIYVCRSCGAHLCIKTPQDSPCGKKFSTGGPPCYLRHHGITSYTGIVMNKT